MTGWIVRAESKGESEQAAWKNNVITVGWNALPDLSELSKKELKELGEQEYEGFHAPSAVTQLWAFVHEIKIGDLVTIPCLKTEFKRFIAVGEVVGNYEFGEIAPDIIHFRRVEWIKRVLRSSVAPDVLKYFNLPGTVYRLNPVAEKQLKEILGGGVVQDSNNHYEHPKNTIFYGPPGTGKTFQAFNRALEIINSDPSYRNPTRRSREKITEEFRGLKNDGQIEFVTFHQSYSYEEFVEGIRPVLGTEESDTSTIQYKITNGIFTNIALAAEADPSENYVLIIDEINRGNISKIFGELITLIEEDKRLGEKNEIRVTLPYSQETFGVPANLYIVGTMNSADRGIALIDIALRRRFTFEPFMPEYEETGLNAVSIDGLNLGDFLKRINMPIAILLDQDHQLGHSYFMKVINARDKTQKLYDVWYQEIIPLLQEYFYNDYEKLEQVLGKYVKDTQGERGFVEKMSELDMRRALAGANDATIVDSYVGAIHKYDTPAHLIEALKRYGE